MTRYLLTIALLTGCADHVTPSDAGPRAVDLGECIGLAATLQDGGPPIAHVYAYDGQPCSGGTCWGGRCEP